MPFFHQAIPGVGQPVDRAPRACRPEERMFQPTLRTGRLSCPLRPIKRFGQTEIRMRISPAKLPKRRRVKVHAVFLGR